MSKSISKLIIAGIALSLAVPVGAYAQQKVTQTHTTTKGVTAKAQQIPQGKRYEILANDGFKARTMQQAGARQLAEKGKVTRPLNFNLNRPSAPLRVEASEPVNGMVIYADSWGNDGAYGIYSLPTDGSNQLSEVAAVPSMAGAQAGVAAGDRYITTTVSQIFGIILGAYVTVYDVNTWEMVAEYNVTSEMNKVALNYAYDPSTGSVYGEFYKADMSGYYFGEMDPETLEVAPIAQLGSVYRAMAFAADGTLYVIDTDGVLYTMDKTTGQTTMVGNTGYASTYISGGAIDQKTGRFYYTTSGDDISYLLEVNPATAEATVLFVMPDGEEVVGMYVPAPAAEPGAPAQVSDLQATFSEGVLNGTVTFTAPTTLFDGTAASGDFTYVIKANGEEIATGTVAAGAEVKYDYTAPASGTYKFTAYCVNEVGDGPKANVSVYVGVDIPLAPTNVNLVYADGKMTLTWDPSQAAHNGYAGEITYTITRYETGKDGVVVAEGVTDCTYTEEFTPETEALINVYYTVEAKNAEGVTAAVASNAVGMGCIIPPYSNSFQTNLSLDGYTIIDANEDGRTFGFYGNDGLRISYNSKADMDDWVITPAVKLEAEKYYAYEVVVANNSNSYAERVEVKAGKTATADGMTIEVIPATQVKTGGQNITLKGSITPDETGEYYIGIHGISDADQFYLYIREFSISDGVSALAPAQVGNVEIASNPANFFEANISFTVPSTNILGEDIITVDWVDIARDGVAIKQYLNPTPGAELNVVDVVPESGTYTYSIIAHGNYGFGLPVEKTVYVGIPVPAAPAEATIARTDVSGQAHVEWTAVTESVDGVDIPAEYITYTIVNDKNEIVGEDLTGTSFDFQACEDGDQVFVYCKVYAKTAGGLSTATGTDMIPVGTPYELPYNESFNDGGISYILGTSSAGGAQWALASNETFSDVVDSDDTNGFAYMTGNYLDQYADLFTGLITLNSDKPALKFDYYNLAEGDINALEIYVTCDGVQQQVANVIQDADGAQIGWNTAYVDLSAYANKTVEVMFRGVVNAYKYILIDAVQIAQLEDYDFKITSVTGPAAVNPDESFTLTATVVNAGALTNSDYKVEIFLNGGSLGYYEGVELATGEKAEFNFVQKQNITAGEQLLYTIKVVCDADANQSDNSADYPVIMNIPNYPVATDLKATLTNNGVALTWEEPNLDAEEPVTTVTEDFEEYTAWEKENLGEWTVYDEDGSPVGGFQGIDIPGIIAGETTASYFIFNDTEVNSTFAAHSGHQYAGALFRYDDGTVADWLISPALSGEAQTVSFYAKSYSASYPDSFQVLYSTTDTDIASFTVVDQYDRIAQDWTCYSFNVPAGAKYFAIKSIATSGFMLMVDDVTYEPADGVALELSIVGYNVYRNGVKINDAPVEETNFVDVDGTTSDKYVVTVVYTIGESAPSIQVGVGTTSGVNDMVAGTAVKVEARTIVVTGAEGTVAVYAADGKAIYSEAAAKTNTIAVTPGVYVVKAGEKVSKVVVK